MKPLTLANAFIGGGIAELVALPGDVVLYRSDNLELRLTPDQLAALIRLDLAPSEYFALRDRYGMAHEWHEDFYDPETGEALQPRES